MPICNGKGFWLSENELSWMYSADFGRRGRGGGANMYFQEKVRGIDPLYWRDMPATASVPISFWQHYLTSCPLFGNGGTYMKLSKIRCDKISLRAKLPSFSKIRFYQEAEFLNVKSTQNFPQIVIDKMYGKWTKNLPQIVTDKSKKFFIRGSWRVGKLMAV